MSLTGLSQAPAIAKRGAVLAAIVSLHVLAIHLLAVGASSHNSLDESVIEADVIPADRHPPSPPEFPQLVFRANSPLKLPILQIMIDSTGGEPPAPTREEEPLDNAVAATATDNVAIPIDPIPVKRPRPISGPRGIDRYPNESMKARESGTVVINICVSPEGRVNSVALARSSGFPRLDAVALGIASEYQFQPALRLGRPVAACDQYRIVFKVI